MKTMSFLLGLSLNLTVWASFLFDASLSPLERRIIERDLENICSLDFTVPTDERFRRIFQMEDASCEGLTAWAKERVRYLMKAPRGRLILGENDHLEEKDILFRLERMETVFFVSPIADILYAANLGGELTEYSNLGQNLDVSLLFVEHDYLSHLRTLLLPVGKGDVGLMDSFFLWQHHPNPDTPDSLANSIFRFSLLLHEARHRNRSGHIPCRYDPQDKRCDNGADGPFGTEASFLSWAIQACGPCSDDEKDILSQHLAMAESRINNPDHYSEEGQGEGPPHLAPEEIDCVEDLGPGATVFEGELGPECPFFLNPRKRAHYWRFSLEGRQKMTISLQSHAVDSYLYLFSEGHSSILRENDDAWNFTAHARLHGVLWPGDYILAATTYREGEEGPYRLEVTLEE